MRWRSGVVALISACACAAGASADALTQATIGGTVTVSAGLVSPGPYTLSLVEPHPTKATTCAAKLAGPKRAVKGHIKLTGTVPTSLRCYSSDGTLLTRIKITPGTYSLFLCQADGPTGCNGSKTVIKHQIVIHAVPKRKTTG